MSSSNKSICACIGEQGSAAPMPFSSARSHAAPTVSPPVVRLIYLVPSDRTPNPIYQQVIGAAAAHLQRWYYDALGSNKTFRLQSPIVETFITPHDSAWYTQGAIWNNALNDGFALTGGGFFDPNNIWIFYLDVDNTSGTPTGGTSGVALLPEVDLLGLTGQHGPVCRWVGGLGHELGHALGLPHPDGCGSTLPDTEPPCQSIMYLGYEIYPQTFLIDDHKATLNKSPFFNQTSQPNASDCAKLGQIKPA
jgi:hypothetical protein